MIGMNFVRRLANASWRRVFVTAIIYGLSLAVRFTSAAGEVETAPQSAQRGHPLMSIMAGDSSRLRYQEWGRKVTQPFVFRQGWPVGSSHTGCTAP